MGGKYLAEFLEKNNYIEQLDIGETDQDIESLVYIAAILQSPNITLRSIDLSKPLLIFSQPHAAEILGKMLYVNVHLRELVLRKCGLGDHDMELLSMGLHKFANETFTIPKLESFAQEETSSSYTEVIVLTEEEEADFENKGDDWSQDERNETKFESSLEENSTDLNTCNPLKRVIAKDGLVSHLLHLDLSCNNISDDTIDYLRLYLLSGPPLLSLNFSHNVLHDVGVIELSKCIPSTKLEALDISHNQVGHDGIRSITFLLKRSSPLQKIYIWGNQLNEEICQVLHESIIDGTILQENIDVVLYEVDEKFFAAYNNRVENHHIKYYCVPQCPLFAKCL
ncbi:hypothetical protein J437_LFUL008265 [Ladona fulva]|uniref:Leucine-rich repeat-containing protein n=1 Tax=Ladona fulva TaxID=123851 RepID=A0A8K0K969_LADFU|nr:hypothetical protein J437_LFUL008265 [Ladona fulva]